MPLAVHRWRCRVEAWVTGHIDPTADALRALRDAGTDRPVVMLNLLRFRATADYSAAPGLAPDGGGTGRDAYRAYMAHAAQHLVRQGGEVLFDGAGSAPVIGPPGELWDRVLLVRYPTVGAFLAMIRDPGYLAGVGHRAAALSDSRLIPLQVR